MHTKQKPKSGHERPPCLIALRSVLFESVRTTATHEVWMKLNPWHRRLEKRGRRSAGGFPVGTLLFYGPDNRRATKVVAAVFTHDGAEPLLAKWFNENVDVRVDSNIGRAVTAFFTAHGVRQVGTTRGLAGCPHEEGIDYPSGEACPRCPFWTGVDRWAEADKSPPPRPLAS
jgi:hypothetical protein